jgi:hypothetical protein
MLWRLDSVHCHGTSFGHARNRSCLLAISFLDPDAHVLPDPGSLTSNVAGKSCPGAENGSTRLAAMETQLRRYIRVSCFIRSNLRRKLIVWVLASDKQSTTDLYQQTMICIPSEPEVSSKLVRRVIGLPKSSLA